MNNFYITVVMDVDEDGNDRQKLYFNKDIQLTVRPLYDSPEDAIIGRALVSCTEITSYMKDAIVAMIKGRNMVFNYEQVDDIYDFDINEYIDNLEKSK